MNNWNRFAAIAIALAALSATGCGAFSFAPTRTSDGGGGNVLTGGLKVVSGQFESLTQDEIQQLSDAASGIIHTVDPNAPVAPPMTNEQADAFKDFLNANSLNSVTDVTNLIQKASNDPSKIIVPQSLVDAYAGTEFSMDGGSVDAVQILENVFGNQLAGQGS